MVRSPAGDRDPAAAAMARADGQGGGSDGCLQAGVGGPVLPEDVVDKIRLHLWQLANTAEDRLGLMAASRCHRQRAWGAVTADRERLMRRAQMAAWSGTWAMSGRGTDQDKSRLEAQVLGQLRAEVERLCSAPSPAQAAATFASLRQRVAALQAAATCFHRRLALNAPYDSWAAQTRAMARLWPPIDITLWLMLGGANLALCSQLLVPTLGAWVGGVAAGAGASVGAGTSAALRALAVFGSYQTLRVLTTAPAEILRGQLWRWLERMVAARGRGLHRRWEATRDAQLDAALARVAKLFGLVLPQRLAAVGP